MTKTNLFSKLAPAAAIVALWAASPVQVAGDAIAPGMDQLVLWSGGNTSLGSDVIITAAAAAGQDLLADSRALLASIYADRNIELGLSATVRGRVLANGFGSAGMGLDLEGDWTSQSVTVSPNARIVGNVAAATGVITIDRNADITGNVLGNHDISIGRTSVVTGDVSPGLGRTLTLGRNVTIGGSTEPASVTADTFVPPSMGDRPDAGEVGTQEIRPGDGATTILDPGVYSDVVLGTSATLGLSGGTYTLQSFWMGGGGTVNIDASAGDVVLNVQGGFSTGNNVQFNKTGQGDLVINVFDYDVGLGDDAVIEAVVRVWGGSFATGKDSALTGWFHATGDVSLASGSLAQPGSAAVPEPAALSVIALGAALALCRRHRRSAGGAGRPTDRPPLRADPRRGGHA